MGWADRRTFLSYLSSGLLSLLTFRSRFTYDKQINQLEVTAALQRTISSTK